ncbi:hypothetical protein [Actinokineospora fastidiosa]|uniref:Secreted protein n=1 Tax=Actinokineospora fastidiosa TaxID=1816 RepID=A0A918GRZ2_9PSEU|nr:hypothetical protein [Actinokineospora fastidiosa]GGS53371.1 hypothetical protein GCM10010171_55860 [Actinokineospora fastidiosa]
MLAAIVAAIVILLSGPAVNTPVAGADACAAHAVATPHVELESLQDAEKAVPPLGDSTGLPPQPHPGRETARQARSVAPLCPPVRGSPDGMSISA